MKGTKYQVRIENVLSEESQVVTGLKYNDVFSSLLFNIALEKVVRSIQRDNCGIDIGTNKISILSFANDLSIVCDYRKNVTQSISALINEAKATRLNVNHN